MSEIKDASGEVVFLIVDDDLTVYRNITITEGVAEEAGYPAGYFDGIVLKAGTYKLIDGASGLESVDPETWDKLNDMTKALVDVEGWIELTSEVTVRSYKSVKIGEENYNISEKLTESFNNVTGDTYSFEYTLSGLYKGIDHFIRYENRSVFPEEVTYTIIGGEYEGNYTTEIASSEP